MLHVVRITLHINSVNMFINWIHLKTEIIIIIIHGWGNRSTNL